MSTTPTPDGLGNSGRSLWDAVTSKYDLRPDERVTLEAACRASDRIAAMEEERQGRVTATGSMGQVVVHPLVAEIRATEAQVSQMLARLKLPDADGSTGSVEQPRSTQARSAAQSRWAAAHGA